MIYGIKLLLFHFSVGQHDQDQTLTTEPLASAAV